MRSDLSASLFRSPLALQQHSYQDVGIYNDLWLLTDKKGELKILIMHPGKNPIGFIIYDMYDFGNW